MRTQSSTSTTSTRTRANGHVTRPDLPLGDSCSALARTLALTCRTEQSARVQIRITRDDVAAADEADERVVQVESQASLSQFLTSTGRTFLPTIHGGRATWIVRRGRRGKPMAVFAQEWGRVEMVGSEDDAVAAFDTVHFDYRAQVDPQATLEGLRPRP